MKKIKGSRVTMGGEMEKLEMLEKWWFWEIRLEIRLEKLESNYIFQCGRLEKLEFLKCSIKILNYFFF